MIDFNSMPFIYWNPETVISFIQRQILVYSYAYYEMDYNFIEDREYDILSKELVRRQNNVPHSVFRKTDYYYCMYDYDGSTGFDLYGRLFKEDKIKIANIAKMVRVGGVR